MRPKYWPWGFIKLEPTIRRDTGGRFTGFTACVVSPDTLAEAAGGFTVAELVTAGCPDAETPLRAVVITKPAKNSFIKSSVQGTKHVAKATCLRIGASQLGCIPIETAQPKGFCPRDEKALFVPIFPGRAGHQDSGAAPSGNGL